MGGKCSGNYRMQKPWKQEGKVHKFVAKNGENKPKAESQPANKLKLAKAYSTHIEPESNYMDELDMRGGHSYSN
jgi:hypothetical protein